ncbi:hypothetical protein P3T73_04675 [Kiritimatiellota bacterium B12222]|nr:hypothetical protein P3T73_04675 [Kiritimatiellota bacterium B12222]
MFESLTIVYLVFVMVLPFFAMLSPATGGVKKGWRAFAGILFLVVLPLLVFGFSGLVIPDSKAACGVPGWIAAMHVGKYALSPFVLWAVVAYCRHLDFPPEGPYPRWVILGLSHGAGIAGVCSLFGLIVYESIWLFPLLICVPIYTAIGYFCTAVHCFKRNRISPLRLLIHLVMEIPFWWVAMEWSQKIYENLPDESTDCFVVTAASKGHPQWVGPFTAYHQSGRTRVMNRQLHTFREFEALWCLRGPRSHKWFRKIYNVIGPRIAARIQNPFWADVVFGCLKPIEWLLRFCLKAKGLYVR